MPSTSTTPQPAIPACTWRTQPEDRDYPAARSYLSLIYKERKVSRLIKHLRKATMTSFLAKDIVRASRLTLLNVDQVHVAADVAKILGGSPLSPLLLIRDSDQGTVIIADGYHRMCAVYALDEDALIPCRIA